MAVKIGDKNMEDLLYSSLRLYYKILCLTGIRNYNDVYCLILLSYLQEIEELTEFTSEDISLMNALLRKLTDCCCLIPQNNIKIEKFMNKVVNPFIYYGTTDIEPTSFLNKTVEELIREGSNFEVVGDYENKFSFIQNKSIHYVVIPDSLVDLVKSYFVNTFATDLWKGDNTGKWAYKTSHKGGDYNGLHYTVYFYYSPSGGFDDPINIIVKNK